MKNCFSQILLSANETALFGITFLILFFALSVVLVVGTKYIIFFLKAMLSSHEPKKPQKQKRQRKKVRSIEINPDEVDRIYVKKAS